MDERAKRFLKLLWVGLTWLVELLLPVLFLVLMLGLLVYVLVGL